ncbi:MAG: family 20 glycosylhydrolase [Bacteroidota bacterium]
MRLENKIGIHFAILVFSFFTSSALAQYRPVELMKRIHLVPQPESVVYKEKKIAFPKEVSVIGLSHHAPEHQRTLESLTNLFETFSDVSFDIDGYHPYKIHFIRKDNLPDEGYELVSTENGVTIYASTASGEFYGAQTLYQLLAFSYWGSNMLDISYKPLEEDAFEKKYIPLLSIQDEPQLELRSFMIDMGRATFPLPYIKRIIRIMAHLKMNMLHIRLFDDELNGFRFQTLPLGQENPYAIDADDLKEIVRYARSYHITVMPEMESWGHVGSIVYHYPDLFGAVGMYGGSSFAIGEPTYQLLEKMYEEVLLCLEDDAVIHVGLDEATWAVLPGEEDNGHTPTTLVGDIYDILMRLGEKHNKEITMHLWADHGGRPLPERITGEVVIEPWEYTEAGSQRITDRLEKYGGENKTALMMGGGVRSTCYDGDYGATRIWCQQGVYYPNVLGITICLWGANDLAGRLISLYGGADYAWTPQTPELKIGDDTGESLRSDINVRMRKWQTLFPDAGDNILNVDRGPETFMGRYLWPPMSNKAVAPTVDFKPE